MRARRRYPIAIVAVWLMSAVASASWAAESVAVPDAIADPQAWAADAIATLSGEGGVPAFSDRLGAALQRPSSEFAAGLQTVAGYAAEGAPVYTDLIDQSQMGTTITRVVHATYWGKLRWVFFAFTFYRADDGWALVDFRFNSDPERVMGARATTTTE